MEEKMEHSRKKMRLMNILKTAGILALCTFVGYLFSLAKLRTENISMIYLVGVLLITVVTGALGYGIAASVVSIFAYNFFFTAPTMTFFVYDPNYIVTLIILLIGSFIVSVLTNKLHRHIADARRREKQMSLLYEISSKFLNLSGMESIVAHGLAGLEKMQPHQCILYTDADFPKVSSAVHTQDNMAAKWCFENVKPCGNGTEYFPNLEWLYLPLRSKNTVFGVAGIHCAQQSLTTDEMLMIRMVISQISEAMERETLYRKQEESKVKIEKEQLRNSLLRAISHDLRTPLTCIAGSADFISGSLGELSKEQLLSLVDGIGNDALWLNNMVENLLNMTRISDGELVLKRQAEVVDDIVSEAYGRAVKIKSDKNIRTHMPDTVIQVPMDGRLIIQVLVNLLDNAIKYTPAKAEIDLSAYPENDYMVFEVSDNGGGIDLGILDKVFDNFVTAPTGAEDSKRGMGIGLSICKSIVEAHGGVIAASNNENGGATFRFALPMK